jgi:uncharacterized protein (DUF305 family)
MDNRHYGRLALMALLSFIAMYALMYAMVDKFANVYPNFNQFYMAGLMAAPMVIIEIALMGAMYRNKGLNTAIAAASVVVLAGFWIAIRQQAAISDQQFLKSMIPHHAGAILMCENAKLSDTAIKELCTNIISGQQAEIEQMKAKLEDLER